MKRSRLIVILVLLLCAALVYAWMATPRQRRVSTPASGRVQLNTPVEQSLDEISEVEELDFPEGSKQTYRRPVKNLFAALYQPPKAVPKPKKKPKPKIKPKTKPKPKPVEVIQPVVQQPMERFKVLGSLLKGEVLKAFVVSSRGEVFVVGEGDVFADDFKVDDLDASNLTIVKTETGQSQNLRIRKVENQRLPALNIKSGRPEFSSNSKEAAADGGTGKKGGGFPTPKSSVKPSDSVSKSNSFIGN